MGVLSFIAELQANDARKKQIELERQKMDVDAQLRREAMKNAIEQVTTQGEQSRLTEAARQEGVRKQTDISHVADLKELHSSLLRVGASRGMSPEQAKDFADTKLAEAISSGKLAEISQNVATELFNKGAAEKAQEVGRSASESGISRNQFSTAMSDLGTLRANAAKDFAGDRAATDEMAQIAQNVASISGAGVQNARNNAALPLAGQEARTNLTGQILRNQNDISTALGRSNTAYGLGKTLDQAAIDKAEAERAKAGFEKSTIGFQSPAEAAKAFNATNRATTAKAGADTALAENTVIGERARSPLIPGAVQAEMGAKTAAGRAAEAEGKFQAATTALQNPDLAATAFNFKNRITPDLMTSEIIRPLSSAAPGSIMDQILRQNPSLQRAIANQLTTSLGGAPVGTNATPGLQGVLGSLKGLK